MKTFLAWAVAVAGSLISVAYLVAGVLRWRKNPARPSIREGFRSRPFSESSGPQLVAEGVFGVAMTILLVWLLFH